MSTENVVVVNPLFLWTYDVFLKMLLAAFLLFVRESKQVGRDRGGFVGKYFVARYSTRLNGFI